MEINKLIKLLNDNIKYDSIEDIIKGDKCTIFKVKISNYTYFFKFLSKEICDKLLLETNVVNHLINNGVAIPEYYSKDNINVFADDQYVFYGTKEVEGKKISGLVNYDLLSNVIENVAFMHKELRKYPISNLDYLEKETDYSRLKKFAESNDKFLIKYEFIDFINKVLKYDVFLDDYMLIHADLNFRNIFVKDNKFLSFIDFTDMRIGCKEDDLGKLWQNILYLDNISLCELKKLKELYEDILGEKININNLIVSCVYRIIYRYYYMITNNEIIPDKYLDKTRKVLEKVLEKEI